jgi:tetratricopeptide (TPR) repeat protein
MLRIRDDDKRRRKHCSVVAVKSPRSLALNVLEFANVLLLGEDGGCWYRNRVYTKTRLFFWSSAPLLRGASCARSSRIGPHHLPRSFPVIGLVAAIILWGTGVHGVTGPMIPTSDDFVLEKLPRSMTGDPELRTLRARLRRDSQNLALAVDVARRCVAQSRKESDPRFLGYAEAALSPWWKLSQPPVDVLVLRATIRQSNHEFESALSDLDLALRLDPINAQAWVTRAVILQVRGDYRGARRSCLPLTRLTSTLAAVTCAASVASINGEAVRSYELLRRTLEQTPNPDSLERLWALSVLAEIATRLGRNDEAEILFREATRAKDHDNHLLSAFADFLLQQHRPREVISLLRSEARSEILCLRLALAEAEVDPTSRELATHVQALRAWFESDWLRGQPVHRREEAMFELHLQHQPDKALALAQANWSAQREPADAIILVEAALAAGNTDAISTVEKWIDENRWEDNRLRRLIAAKRESRLTSLSRPTK